MGDNILLKGFGLLVTRFLYIGISVQKLHATWNMYSLSRKADKSYNVYCVVFRSIISLIKRDNVWNIIHIGILSWRDHNTTFRSYAARSRSYMLDNISFEPKIRKASPTASNCPLLDMSLCEEKGLLHRYIYLF